MKLTRNLMAAAAALALLATPAALAKNGEDKPGKGNAHAEKPGKGKGHGKPDKGKGKKKPKNVVLKGTFVSYDAATGAITVKVAKATKYGRFLVGTEASFKTAKVSVADTDGDGTANAADLVAGDKVLVQARIGKSDVAPYAARKLVDQTNPEADEDEDDDDDEAEDEAPAPAAVATP